MKTLIKASITSEKIGSPLPLIGFFSKSPTTPMAIQEECKKMLPVLKKAELCVCRVVKKEGIKPFDQRPEATQRKLDACQKIMRSAWDVAMKALKADARRT